MPSAFLCMLMRLKVIYHDQESSEVIGGKCKICIIFCKSYSLITTKLNFVYHALGTLPIDTWPVISISARQLPDEIQWAISTNYMYIKYLSHNSNLVSYSFSYRCVHKKLTWWISDDVQKLPKETQWHIWYKARGTFYCDIPRYHIVAVKLQWTPWGSNDVWKLLEETQPCISWTLMNSNLVSLKYPDYHVFHVVHM